MTLLVSQFLVNGLLVGGVYALIAVGVVFIYRAIRVFNFAVGEMLVFGAFIAWGCVAILNLPFILALFIAILGSIVLGLLIERLLMRPLIGQPILSSIMATLGLSVFLRGVMSLAWGTDPVSFPYKIIPGKPLIIKGVIVSDQLLWGFVLAFVVFGFLIAFFEHGKIGLGMRTTAEDHQIAQATGINVKRVFAITWCVSGVVASLGGILLASRIGLSVVNTPLVAFKVFPAILFGGLESILGAVIGGLIVGILENLAGGLIDPRVAEITPYIILLIVLMIRPEGLFGLKRIERV
jgi:branched-chain amino acid transport system permease protein